MGTVLVISPHLDDAVLSYGGRLAALADAGHDVVVYTMFAGTPSPPYSPPATAYHEQWELTGDPVAPRREEDRLALAVLGVAPRHGSYLDAIYRRDERGGWLIREGEPTEFEGDEPALLADIAATVEDLIRELDPERLVTCAAIGNHVDHRRARDGALLAAAGAGVPAAVWDDFPYVTWASDVPALPDGLRLGEPVAEPLTGSAWQAWITAVGCYASQLAMLEQDGTPLPRWYTEHCESQATRYGITGLHEVVRQLSPGPTRREADHVGAAAAGVRRHRDL